LNLFPFSFVLNSQELYFFELIWFLWCVFQKPPTRLTTEDKKAVPKAGRQNTTPLPNPKNITFDFLLPFLFLLFLHSYILSFPLFSLKKTLQKGTQNHSKANITSNIKLYNNMTEENDETVSEFPKRKKPPTLGLKSATSSAGIDKENISNPTKRSDGYVLNFLSLEDGFLELSLRNVVYRARTASTQKTKPQLNSKQLQGKNSVVPKNTNGKGRRDEDDENESIAESEDHDTTLERYLLYLVQLK
jgi:hypothetical protein